MFVLALSVLVLAALPAWLFTKNARRYRPAPPPVHSAISILIPARNEAAGIGECIHAALNSRHADIEVVVFDDQSTDSTAAIVSDLAAKEHRLRLESAPLPAGWAGKQFACWTLGNRATHDTLLFIDADVRLRPDCAARLAAFRLASASALVSGIPRQETVTLLERLLIPLIHFVMLGFLPISRMRRSTSPMYGAGCGQVFLTTKRDYLAAGGHAAIRDSFHDGVRLPQAYRRASLKTDLCDMTDLADCRMYRSGRELWLGVAKNAGEGLGTPAGIVPWTVILLGGQVLPFGLLAVWPLLDEYSRLATFAAVVLCYWSRILGAVLYRQTWLGVFLHPVGVTVLVAIQWYALLRRVVGRPVGWKGRTV